MRYITAGLSVPFDEPNRRAFAAALSDETAFDRMLDSLADAEDRVDNFEG
ncbi:hypothetical protein [Kribbella sp. NPDC049227]